jgi:SAM-dependent methyltransferase
MKIVTTDWYRFPRYYDLAFQSETKPQADFVEAACRRYGRIPVRRLLEPACGSGRLVVELAKRAYHLTGFDRCRESLSFLKQRLRRQHLAAELFEADLADFSLRRRCDAAFCFCNTFRYLLTETQARQHLLQVAGSLRVGGIYIVGLHVMPPDADLLDCERWTERAGRTSVTVTLRVLESYPKRRLELLRTSLLARTPSRELRVRTDYLMRMYTAGQLRRLLESVPQLELCDVFDFWYQIDEPLQLDDNIADTVIVLRKRCE